MRSTLSFFSVVTAVSLLIAAPASAQPAESSAERRDASNWLRGVQVAAQRLSYSGTFVYQQGSKVRTSRITHVIDGGNEYEKLEILDGRPREYIRNNDEVVAYLPETRTLIVEKRAGQEAFPAIVAAAPSDLAAHYAIRKAESGRIAGFDCQAIVLEPKDRLRYGYKLWAEKGSGLLLRAQTLDERHEVIEQIAFTQVAIGNVERSRTRPSHANTAGWQVEHATMNIGGSSGWVVKGLPDGFAKVRELRRVVDDVPAGGSSGGPGGKREIVHLVYSDGLAAISVFVEPGTQSKTEGSLRQGAMNVIGKRQGDFWLTIVGEVPMAALRQVANSIEYNKSR